MSILDKIPNLFGSASIRFKKKTFKKFDKNVLFPYKRDFVKRDDVIKKIVLDKVRIPQTGWAPPIRGRFAGRVKRKELAESLFPKEKFGDYVSRKKLQETMRELEKISKTYKPSHEKFDALQKYNYLKKKSGL